MRKQLFIALLVPWLLFYLTGCYTMSDITKEDLKQNKTQNGDLRIITNGGDTYFFKAYNYIVKKDTLIGLSSKTERETNTPSSTKIPMNDISACGMESINTGVSILAVIGFIGVGVLIWGLVAAHEIGEGISNLGKH